MAIAYQFFLYLPVPVQGAGIVDVEKVLNRAADKWNFDYQLAVANGDGYGDPRELGVLKAERDTLEQAENLLAQVIGWLPVPYETQTPAEALNWVKVWGAPEAYFQDGELVKP